MGERGSSSVLVLAFILVLSLLGAGIVAYLQTFSKYIRRSIDRSDRRNLLIEKAEDVVDLLIARGGDDADSPLSPVFGAVEQLEAGGFAIRLTDVSSFLGLNWIRKTVLEQSGLLEPIHQLSDAVVHEVYAGIVGFAGALGLFERQISSGFAAIHLPGEGIHTLLEVLREFDAWDLVPVSSDVASWRRERRMRTGV